MFRNNLKTAWRSLMRNKINSVINIGGLSIAIASVIFIMMYVKDELAYDRFFNNADHIFQVNSNFTEKGVTNTSGGNTAPAVTPTMQRMYPEIESYARIYRPGDVLVRY
jgi:putative ABC transport system permease protein